MFLVHVQHLCQKIVQSKQSTITPSLINALAQQIIFDDEYLSHIQKHLQNNERLRKRALAIYQKPMRSSRTTEIIATLEVKGIICHNPLTNKWQITNKLCEQIIEKMDTP